MHKYSRFKKFKLLVVVFIIGLFFVVSENLYNKEVGSKYFKNYSYKEYDHQPQNWGIAKGKNGMIYAANNGGVLIFDGISWQVIGIPGYAPARSLAIDETGTVYIGGKGEIGYLAPSSNGAMKYVSLVNHLNSDQKKFSNVWRTYATKEGVYFCPSEMLIRWHPKRKQIKVWKPQHRFFYSFSIKGRLLIHQEKIGVMHMVKDSLEILIGDKIFTEPKERVFMIVPYADDRDTLLIGTRLKGFFLYDGITVKPFSTGVEEYLNKSMGYHGIRLSSGDFSLATRFGGLVIMDSLGGLKYIFDKNSGLQDSDVKYVFQENQGNLWLCLDKGISKIEYASPFFIYDNRAGLPGIVLAVSWHHKDLYVGTTKGLYMLRSNSNTFQPVSNISGSCWSLLSVGDSILAATSRGVFQVKKNIKRRVIEELSFVLLPSQKSPGRIWCGTKGGLRTLSLENNQWIEERKYEIIKQEIRFIAEDKNGHLWLSASAGGVIELDPTVASNRRQPEISRYNAAHGLPTGRVYASMAAGHVMFATKKGIFRFNEDKGSFIPDETLGAEFTGGENSKYIFLIAEDKNKNVWLHSEGRNYQAIPMQGEPFSIYSTPFKRIPLIQVNSIYPDPDGRSTWFASFDGLIRYDTTKKKNYQQNFQTIIRMVNTNERMIFSGNKIKAGASETLPKILEYEERSFLHFEFSAPFFEAEHKTVYQSKLEGHEKDWSAWSKESKRNYTNLDSGIYTFRVRAKNIYGKIGDEDLFQFKIQLPWHKTWWAYLAYALTLSLFFYLIAKWRRSIRLEKEKLSLEQIVVERTSEIKEKNRQLKEQAQKLQEMDKMKTRFFTNISHEFRTPLTLIMTPLEHMLREKRNKKQKKDLQVMLRNSKRLHTLINQLLELARIDGGKTLLQAGPQDLVSFIRGIVSEFSMQASSNQLELEFHSRQESLILYFEPERMEEIIVNLLINALKFTPAGGKITVSISIHDPAGEERFGPEFVDISVRDTGIGIPEDQLPHIFDRFYQVDDSFNREQEHKGTGIGLALVRELVALHHGKMNVHSTKGKGTTFVIQLPLGSDHLKPQEIVDTAGRQFPIFPEGDIAQEEEDTGSHETDTGKNDDEGTDEHGKNVILVVEDQAEVRSYIKESLEPFYDVKEAVDGGDGIKKAKEIIPDLIVTDIMMPKVDGYLLCKTLKKNIETSHIPIIVLTAKAEERSIIRGLKTGVDDYITKPHNTKILLNRIKNLIDLRSHLQHKIQQQMLLKPAEIPVTSLDQRFLEDLQRVIEENLSDELFNVEQLRKKLHMSKSSLYRKILALTGEKPRDFIKSHRLKRASQLLRDNYGNVNEVAFEVGFSNTSYFIKCFKEKHDLSPFDYKEEYQRKKNGIKDKEE